MRRLDHSPFPVVNTAGFKPPRGNNTAAKLDLELPTEQEPTPGSSPASHDPETDSEVER